MTIEKRHIFKAGITHDGREITAEDVLKLYESTRSAMDNGYKIPLKEGHNDKEQAAKGWAENLIIEGENLYVDFINIEEALYEKIKSGYLPGVSIEIYKNFKWKGDDYKSIIAAVALLGIDAPACELEPAVFKNSEVEYIIFKNLSTEKTGFNKEPSLKSDNDSDEISYFSLKAEYDIALNKISSLEDELKELRREKLVFSVNSDLVSKGKITPCMRDELLNLFEKESFSIQKCERLIDFYKKMPETTLLEEYSFKNNEKNKDAKKLVFANRLGLSSHDLEKYGDS